MPAGRERGLYKPETRARVALTGMTGHFPRKDTVLSSQLLELLRHHIEDLNLRLKTSEVSFNAPEPPLKPMIPRFGAPSPPTGPYGLKTDPCRSSEQRPSTCSYPWERTFCI